MGSQLLPISQSETQEPSALTDSLIKQWLFRFGVEHKEDIAPRLPLWLEAFTGMDPKILESLFKKAFRACKFFPKVAEILEPLRHAEETATPQAGIEAWERVLGLRRQYWNPDAPGGFWPGMPKLSERVQAACRASGVFRDFESTEELHTWAKKTFIASFVAWGETEQNKYLLPDGEVKDLLAGFAQTKALPAPSQNWDECRIVGESYRAQLATQGLPDLSLEERLRVADELAAAARKVLDQPREHVVAVSDETRKALRYQAELIKSRYPNERCTDPRLREFLLEPPEQRPAEMEAAP